MNAGGCARSRWLRRHKFVAVAEAVITINPSVEPAGPETYQTAHRAAIGFARINPRPHRLETPPSEPSCRQHRAKGREATIT